MAVCRLPARGFKPTNSTCVAPLCCTGPSTLPTRTQVCECVVILKNLKDVSWTGAKAMMTDPGFLKSLVEFDKDGLSEKQVKKVKTEYMKDPNFTYESIKNVSTAGAGGWRESAGQLAGMPWGRT